jgi:hypothetical protein
MSLESIASIAAATTSPAPTPPFAVVSKDVTPIMPPGYTQTQTINADGVETTVITDPAGGTVDTIYGTSTMDTVGSEVSVWA